ncbi:carbohydrate ABC transporter permease [Halococcus saccharolyticus]|uniref:Sugar ABC transporter permease n=1 Tax=Halococcus saccharolyticus DSM 5350 TaxID=1227455 RepID=M0MKB8_9EURY|nr:sugar ABC transporter permease [Halococcus saccharolyticus]EMA46096.1 sugar ABC transporter permease [Halococcus saccharolyticus DSM 5350]
MPSPDRTDPHETVRSRLRGLAERLTPGSDDRSSDDDARAVRTDGGTTVSGGSGSTATSQGGWLRSLRKSGFVSSLPFWLPPFLLMGLFVYGAIGWNFLISLTDMEGFGDPEYSSLDFEQYTELFASQTFIDAARNTFVLLVAFTILCIVLGLVLAILLDRTIRFQNTFRTLYLLPFSLSFVVTAQLWSWMYDIENGIVNSILGVVGLQPDWIGNPQLVLGAVIFALVWQFSGYTMVVFLAGLQTIPDEHFEAARIDGASTVKMYWRVIVPQLRGSMISALVVLMIAALKAFDFLYALFGQYRPAAGADILATFMVREAYSNQNWAYGSAIAIVLYVLALLVVIPYLYSQYRRGEL